MWTTISAYAVYLALSIVATIWVAQTLFKNGRIFLLDNFGGNAEIADAINHLLLVGFYLVNLGYITFTLKFGRRPGDLEEAFLFVSTKLGLVLLILGIVHFANIFVLARFRRPEAPPARRQTKGIATLVENLEEPNPGNI